MASLHFCVKTLEEIVCHRLGCAVDQPLAKLGNLSADLSLHGVGQFAAGRIGRERDGGRPLAVARHTALAFKRQLVTRRRIDIAQRDLARELGRNRADFHGHPDGVPVVADRLELVTAGKANLQCFGVVEGAPSLLLGDAEGASALHVHDGCPVVIGRLAFHQRGKAAGKLVECSQIVDCQHGIRLTVQHTGAARQRRVAVETQQGIEP